MWFICNFRLSVALEDLQEIGDGEYNLMDNISTRSTGLLCCSFTGLKRRIKDSRTKMITMILRRKICDQLESGKSDTRAELGMLGFLVLAQFGLQDRCSQVEQTPGWR